MVRVPVLVRTPSRSVNEPASSMPEWPVLVPSPV
jgi:hypothetical protein